MIGARLKLTVGGTTQSRQVMPTRGYQPQSELAVTFGLGGAERVDSLIITWPDGSRHEVDAVELERLDVIEQPGKQVG